MCFGSGRVMMCGFEEGKDVLNDSERSGICRHHFEKMKHIKKGRAAKKIDQA